MFKYKVNDTVTVTIGKDKNQTGKVIATFPKRHSLIVEGKNTYKKHQKAKSGGSGQVATLSRPLDVAKIALVCPNCKKTTRVGFEGVGKAKVRICKKCSGVISLPKEKK